MIIMTMMPIDYGKDGNDDNDDDYNIGGHLERRPKDRSTRGASLWKRKLQ